MNSIKWHIAIFPEFLKNLHFPFSLFFPCMCDFSAQLACFWKEQLISNETKCVTCVALCLLWWPRHIFYSSAFLCFVVAKARFLQRYYVHLKHVRFWFFVFFFFFFQDYTYSAVKSRQFLHFFHKKSKQQHFDVVQYNKLKEDLAKVPYCKYHIL